MSNNNEGPPLLAAMLELRLGPASLSPVTYADRIRALAHVQSLDLEPDGWCCHLHPGLTTAALGGSGTIIDPSIRTVWAFVKGRPLPAQET